MPLFGMLEIFQLGEKAEHSFTPHAFLSRPFRVKRDSTLSSPEWTI
jgi:hypothetical protein